MSTLLPVVAIQDIPTGDQPEVAVGTIAAVDITPSQSGEYQRVDITVVSAGPNGGDRTTHLRFNLKPEWLTAEFAARFRAQQLPENESLQYRINVAGLWRGLFQAAGQATTSLDALVGKQVGFRIDFRRDKAGQPAPDKNGEIRAELKGFFAPDKLPSVQANFAKRTKAGAQAEPKVSF